MDQDALTRTISGFSKLSKDLKLKWVVDNFFGDPEAAMAAFMRFRLADEDGQKLLEKFSENTLSNYCLPYGVAPNFIINERAYCVPMVTEESSVVAAAANAAKYWQSRGGFRAAVIGTTKIGQIFFRYGGAITDISNRIELIEKELVERASDLTTNMESRGGGIRQMHLMQISPELGNLHQLRVEFETVDSMGANFINSVLERFASCLVEIVRSDSTLGQDRFTLEILMAILSNYTPGCVAKAWVECPVDQLGHFESFTPVQLAKRFQQAIEIARYDVFRATTHNKGILNGVDAVVMATGNDFRAVEANIHAYAAREGCYRGLTQCEIADEVFRFTIELPVTIGTVGGLTTLHPLARESMNMMGNPTAAELMMVIAAMGLAQNFSAVKSLVTTGIQKGHMRMHLGNVLAGFDATEEEACLAREYFANKPISYADVRQYLMSIRVNHTPSGSAGLI